MLDKDIIRAYRAYKGDTDAWSRNARGGAVTDTHWHLIASLIQDITITDAGGASVEFEAALQEKIKDLCKDEETQRLLWATARALRM